MTKPSASSDARIVILSDAMSERNGVGVYYADLRAHLQAHVGLCEIDCPPHRAADAPAFRSVPMPGDATQRLYLPAWRAISRRVIALAPTCIIVATPGPYGFLGVRLARRLGIPLCVGFHTNFDSLAEMYWKRASRVVCRTVLARVHWGLFRAADVVVGYSSEMIRLAHQTGAKRTALVGTPLGPTFASTPTTPIREIRRVVFAARLAPEKNVHLFLEAAEALPDLQFTVVGDGPLRGLVEEKAAALPNLTSLGWCSRESVRQAIDDHDILILPSTVESFGTIALEGMARQRIVIVSPRCGILDFPDLAPWIQVMGQYEALAETIRRASKLAPDELQRISEGAKSAACALNDRAVRAWLDLINSLEPRRRTPIYQLPLSAVKWLRRRRSSTK